MLAIFSVTNLDDAGAGSLRQAVIDANNMAGADTVDLSAVSGTIALTSGEVEIIEALTIDSPGQNVLTIDGQENSRIFEITATTYDFTIAGLTLTAGRTIEAGLLGVGGAIRSSTTWSNSVQHNGEPHDRREHHQRKQRVRRRRDFFQ